MLFHIYFVSLQKYLNRKKVLIDMNTELLKQCEAKAQSWLAGNYNEETKEAVRRMLDNEDKTELIDAFYQNLEFGTGGL